MTSLPLIPSPTSTGVTDGEVKHPRSQITHQRLPTPKQNGGLTNQRLTSYRHDGSRYKADSVGDKFSKISNGTNQVEQANRLVYSAPNKKGRTAPLPKLNNLVNQKLEPINNTLSQPTGYAGITTKERDTRQGKFATSWANTRVTENIVRTDIQETKAKPENTSKPKQKKDTKGDKQADTQKSNFQFHAIDTNKEKKDPQIMENSIKNTSEKKQRTKSYTDKENRDKYSTAKENKPPITPRDSRLMSHNERNNRDKQTIQTHDFDEKRLIDKETEVKRLARLGLGKFRYRERKTPVSPRRKWREPLGVADGKNTHRKSKREEQTELTFKPNINRKNEVFTIYTGLTKRDVRNDHMNKKNSHSNSERDDVNCGSKTSSIHVSSVTTPHQKEYILTRREARAYINMHSAYNNSDIKKQRKAQLLDKLSEAQLAAIKHHNETIRRKEKQRQESKLRQQRQLTYLRRKFQKEQSRRFRSQYVTNRVLEHEVMNRNDFGLPEELDEEVSFSAKLKRKKQKPIEDVNKTELRKQNEKKLEKMLSAYNTSPSPQREKVPKMEGIDTIEILEKDKNGKMIQKKKMVADIIKEAEREIKSTKKHNDNDEDCEGEFGEKKTKSRNEQKSKLSSKSLSTKPSSNKYSVPTNKYPTSESPPPVKDTMNISVDSLDLDDDDDDIFERARKKYGLDIDSSLDTNSRH